MRLPDGEDWLMRPVIEGLCKYESLKDGTLDLEDFMRMNDALNVRDENNMRLQEAAKRERS
ncbi:MAG: DUF6889 family protein [Janthinobacterium lividum]